jgi:hypothetical protein
MIADLIQPYNKRIIDLVCSVCTVKYQLGSVYKHMQCQR